MKTELSRDEVRNSGERSNRARSGRRSGGNGDPDLTVSVFLRGSFVRALEGYDYAARQGTLAASVEGRIRSLCPDASVWVGPADLLDGDWEVQVGELGPGRMGGVERADIERRLRWGVCEVIARFRGQGG